jgi:hypothetical protein
MPKTLTDENYRITGPTTRRVIVAIANHPPAPRRMWLMSLQCDGEREQNALVFHAGDDVELRRMRSVGRRGRSPLGTWRRYAEEQQLAREIVDALGWTLTDDEAALLDALDAYAGRCPARYGRALAS